MIQKRLKTAFKIVFLLISVSASGQNKYWVYLKDKGDSLSTLQLEYLQQSVNENYINKLKDFGQTEITSRWLNAISINLEDTCWIRHMKKLSFVQSVEPIAIYATTSIPLAEEGKTSMALEQIDGRKMQQAGYSGKGVKIGIIDGGFYKADTDEALVKSKMQVKAFRDYITPFNQNPFHGRESFLDWHGTTVWKMIAGQNEKKGITFGLATESQFYLARTDHGKKESRAEEDYLVAALEWMDSLDVRLVNISLGYAMGFDNPQENHHPAELDGKSSALTRAVQIAAEQRGMIIIVAAGNEGGDKRWQVLSIPADAKDVISVGATRFDISAKAIYSSMGPEKIEFTKPELSCYSGSGTSFSAPVITGLVACMLEADSTLNHRQIKDLLVRSSHLYPYANNYIGYGVPDVAKLLQLMNDQTVDTSLTKEIRLKGNHYSMRTDARQVLVFHKKDSRNVIAQEVLSVKKGKLKILRPKDALRTTLNHGEEVLEIFWE